MLGWALRGAAFRSVGFVLVCTLALGGCGGREPERTAKNRRELGTSARNAATLDGLPLVRLYTDPGINLDEYTPSEIWVSGDHYDATEAKYRGSTSAEFPKKSFTLKFGKNRWLDDERRTGFTHARKVVLISSFDEKSLVRQGLALELWNRMDPEHLQVRTAFVSVVVNDEYEGVYLMADHVGDHLMERHGLWEDGNLYQARSHHATLAVDDDRSPHRGFTKEEGDPEEGEGAFADLDEFAEWLADADEKELTDGLGARIDVRDYMDWWILVNLIDASDSAGKNSFHYRDPRTAEPPNVFRCLPWDFNASFGQDWRTRFRWANRGLDYYDGSNRVFARLAGSEHFGPLMRARFRTLLSGSLTLEWVEEWLAGARARIDKAARQDEACWQDAYREVFGSFREELPAYDDENRYVSGWVKERWAFVSEELGASVEPPPAPHPDEGSVDGEGHDGEGHDGEGHDADDHDAGPADE